MLSRHPQSPMRTRHSNPYSCLSSLSQAGSPTLAATTLDAGYISAWATTTTGRGLTKVAMSGISPARYDRSRAGSVVRKIGGRVVYEDGLEDEDEDRDDQERRPLLALGREVVLRSRGLCTSKPTHNVSTSTRARRSTSCTTHLSKTPAFSSTHSTRP